MTNSRVLITGGMGFVAHWMQTTIPVGVWAIGCGHNDYDTWEWDKLCWTHIVHLAPVSPARVLAYAQKHGTRVLFASSGAVYERTGEYADNKRAWEQECLDSGADVVVARPFCFVGEHLQLDRYAIGGFIQDGLSGGPVRYYDIGCIRSYMHGEDLGKWLWAMLLEGEGTYDVGGQWPVSMKTVAETVARVCECETASVLLPEDDKPQMYLPNILRAYDELGLRETVHLEEAIRRTVEWNKERMRK